MNNYEKQYKKLLLSAMTGHKRNTRTGITYGTFGETVKIDLSEGFPATTGKKLAWNSVVGELLWFLSGSTHLSDLRKYTFGEDTGQWTIWSDDAERWNKGNYKDDPEHLGELYGEKWREYGSEGIDQIQNLIDNLKNNPEERNHLVVTWDTEAIAENKMALKPCHVMFQCYVADGKLSLQWYQRSADLFLGVPFNFASYALLCHLLAKWVGLEVGTLSVTFGDCHVYQGHLNAVDEYLNNENYHLPVLKLPEGCDTLESTLKLTALDFKKCLVDYKHCGVIKAPLSVGE